MKRESIKRFGFNHDRCRDPKNWRGDLRTKTVTKQRKKCFRRKKEKRKEGLVIFGKAGVASIRDGHSKRG